MYGIHFQLIVYILVVLENMFQNKIYKYLVKAGYTWYKGRLSHSHTGSYDFLIVRLIANWRTCD